MAEEFTRVTSSTAELSSRVDGLLTVFFFLSGFFNEFYSNNKQKKIIFA